MSLCDCNSLRSLQKEALQITVKVCQACRKEFAYCFCNNLCKEITSSKGHYYLTCANDQCMQIAIRCQYCKKLCNIYVSKSNKNLFWGCSCQGDSSFFKVHVEVAARKYVTRLSNLTHINEEILCNLIIRNVDFFNFKKIVNILNRENLIDTDNLVSSLNNEYPTMTFDKSDFGIVHTPQGQIDQNQFLNTPQRQIDQTFIDNQFLRNQDISPTNSTSQNQFLNIFTRLNEIDEKFEEFERFKSQTHMHFNNVESRFDEFKNKNSEFERRLLEMNGNFENKFNEIQLRTTSIDENYKTLNQNVQDNFSALFQKLDVNDTSFAQNNQVIGSIC